jgi:hypothetical protein
MALMRKMNGAWWQYFPVPMPHDPRPLPTGVHAGLCAGHEVSTAVFKHGLHMETCGGEILYPSLAS